MTNCDLQLKTPPLTDAETTLLRTRSTLTPYQCFRKYLNDGLFAAIQSGFKDGCFQVHQKSTRGPKPKISENKLMRFIATIIWICGNRPRSLSDALGADKTITKSVWQTYRKYLRVNIEDLFDHFNAACRENIKVCICCYCWVTNVQLAVCSTN